MQFTAVDIKLLRPTTDDPVAPIVRASASTPQLVSCHLDVLITVIPEQRCFDALAPVASALCQQVRTCMQAPTGRTCRAMHFWPDELPFPVTLVCALTMDGSDAVDLRMF